MSYQPCRTINDILNDGAQAATLHVTTNRCVILSQTFLTHHAQQIVSKDTCM